MLLQSIKRVMPMYFPLEILCFNDRFILLHPPDGYKISLGRRWFSANEVQMTDHSSISIYIVLNSNQFARRWRDIQSTSAPPLLEGKEEEAWRERTLELLSRAHTIGGIEDASFEIVQSTYAV
jgi:hypothetical protein